MAKCHFDKKTRFFFFGVNEIYGLDLRKEGSILALGRTMGKCLIWKWACIWRERWGHPGELQKAHVIKEKDKQESFRA